MKTTPGSSSKEKCGGSRNNGDLKGVLPTVQQERKKTATLNTTGCPEKRLTMWPGKATGQEGQLNEKGPPKGYATKRKYVLLASA